MKKLENIINMTKEKIKIFLKKILIKKFLKDSGLKMSDYEIKEDLSIDVKKGIDISKWSGIFKELPVKFNKADDDFIVSPESENNFISMIGFPRYIGGDFYFNHSKITDLKYGPEIVKGNYNVNNNRINDLTWTPKEVGGILDFSNNQITDFKNLEKFEKINTVKKRKNNEIRINEDFWMPRYSGSPSSIKYERVIKNNNPIGRRISTMDPYGEENWNE